MFGFVWVAVFLFILVFFVEDFGLVLVFREDFRVYMDSRELVILEFEAGDDFFMCFFVLDFGSCRFEGLGF